MEFLKKYLRQKGAYLLVIFLCIALLLLSFWLYQLPMIAVLYPLILCLFLILTYTAIDFRRQCKTHRQLINIKAHLYGQEGKNEEILEVRDNVRDLLPKTEGVVEEDLSLLWEGAEKTLKEVISASELKEAEIKDYYTLWVHQIKTPIASMRLTLQNEDTDVSRKLLADLMRIEQYVEMVLAYLRLDSNETDFVFASLEIDGIVKQAIRRFSSEFISRKIRLEYTPIRQSIITDEKWLVFVLEQVLSNALKYTPTGSIRIFSTEPGQIIVEDTGIGIEESDLPRIFEQGYTGYNGRTDKKASGLGLYLCRRTLARLQGTIKAESTVGKGTRITILLKPYPINEPSLTKM